MLGWACDVDAGDSAIDVLMTMSGAAFDEFEVEATSLMRACKVSGSNKTNFIKFQIILCAAELHWQSGRHDKLSDV